mmetsp:Transcript_63773/g.149497  ORF Transcript_63773/g.149497 Transcript_63773/m.149497 type:complete len:191 (-) Transcript_63773:182-754(-)|eukprot:s1324_g36.t1
MGASQSNSCGWQRKCCVAAYPDDSLGEFVETMQADVQVGPRLAAPQAPGPAQQWLPPISQEDLRRLQVQQEESHRQQVLQQHLQQQRHRDMLTKRMRESEKLAMQMQHLRELQEQQRRASGERDGGHPTLMQHIYHTRRTHYQTPAVQYAGQGVPTSQGRPCSGSLITSKTRPEDELTVTELPIVMFSDD